MDTKTQPPKHNLQLPVLISRASALIWHISVMTPKRLVALFDHLVVPKNNVGTDEAQHDVFVQVKLL